MTNKAYWDNIVLSSLLADYVIVSFVYFSRMLRWPLHHWVSTLNARRQWISLNLLWPATSVLSWRRPNRKPPTLSSSTPSRQRSGFAHLVPSLSSASFSTSWRNWACARRKITRQYRSEKAFGSFLDLCCKVKYLDDAKINSLRYSDTRTHTQIYNHRDIHTCSYTLTHRAYDLANTNTHVQAHANRFSIQLMQIYLHTWWVGVINKKTKKIGKYIQSWRD